MVRVSYGLIAINAKKELVKLMCISQLSTDTRLLDSLLTVGKTIGCQGERREKETETSEGTQWNKHRLPAPPCVVVTHFHSFRGIFDTLNWFVKVEGSLSKDFGLPECFCFHLNVCGAEVCLNPERFLSFTCRRAGN